MAVAFRSTTYATSGGSSVLTSNAGEPASAAQNDILLVLVVCGATPTSTLSMAGGWSQVPGALWVGSTSRAAVFWQRRGSSAPDYTVTQTISQYIASCATCWSGCETNGNPWNVAVANAAQQRNPGAPDCPSITTTVPNTVAVALGMGWDGELNSSGWGAPTGYSIANNGSVENLGDIAVFYKALATATTEDPSVFTNSAGTLSDVGELTLALMPPQGSAGILMMRGIG